MEWKLLELILRRWLLMFASFLLGLFRETLLIFPFWHFRPEAFLNLVFFQIPFVFSNIDILLALPKYSTVHNQKQSHSTISCTGQILRFRYLRVPSHPVHVFKRIYQNFLSSHRVFVHFTCCNFIITIYTYITII